MFDKLQVKETPMKKLGYSMMNLKFLMSRVDLGLRVIRIGVFMLGLGIM